MIDFPKQLKGFAILPHRESIHIYRDPPSSKYTRKKERVEWGDVKGFVENDSSRYDEALLKFNRGVDPMVETVYTNTSAGSRTTTMPNVEAKNPYTIIRRDAFRPPMYRQEDLLPLSRMRRPYTYRTTNGGVRGSFVDSDLAGKVDKQPITASTSVIVAGAPSLPPSKSYIISTPVETCVSQNIQFDKKYQTMLDSNPSSSVKAEYFDDEFAKNIQEQQLEKGHLPSEANKNSLVKASSSMPGTTLQDLPEMNDREISNGIKEHTLLEELYSVPSLNIYNSETNNNFNVNGINEENIHIPLSSNPSDVNKLQQIHEDLELERKNALLSVFAPQHDHNRLITTHDPEYQFERNGLVDKLGTPIKYDYHRPGEQRLDKELTKQIREVNGSTNPSYFIKRNNEELMMERREKTKLNKQTHYNSFEAKPNNFTMDRHGLTSKMKRKPNQL